MIKWLAPHWQLVSAPWRQRHTDRAYGGIIAMAVLLLAVAGVLGFLKGGDPQAMLRALSGAVAGYIQVLWMLQIMSFVQFNHPTYARIVPVHVRKLRETTVALWLISSLLSGLILGQAFGHAGNWFLLSAICMVLLTLSIVRPTLWIGATLLSPWWLNSGITEFVRQSVMPFYESWPLLCGAAPLLLCAGILTRVVIRNGSAGHVKSFERMRRLRLSTMPNAEGRQGNLQHLGEWGTRILKVVLFPLNRYMQYLVRNPKRTPANLMARAELVFGVDVHWAMQASIAACFAVLAGLTCALARVYWGLDWAEKLRPTSLILAVCMLCVGWVPSLGLHAAIFRSRREQALLMLLPGVPRGGGLNRLIAKRMLRQAVVVWLIAALVASQLPFAPGQARLVLAAYIGILPSMALLIQDWSRIGIQNPISSFANFVAIATGPIACFVAMQFLGIEGPVVMVVSLVISLTLLRWRWSRMQRFPAALPAGRLATA
jgi:hypothetical protein